jgi:hypothetical protein
MVRLSNGVFNPYTSMNLTFFAKDVTSAIKNDYQRNPASRN